MGLPKPNAMVLAWELDLRIEQSVVQFRAPTVDTGMVKNIKKPQITAKKGL